MRRIIVSAIAAMAFGVTGIFLSVPLRGQAAQPAGEFPAGAKVAFVDVLRIARQSTEGQAAADQLKALGDKRVSELTNRGKALEAQLQQLQQSKAEPADPVRLKLRTDIENNQRDLVKARRDAEFELAELETRLTRDFSRRLGPVIQQVAAQRQLHVVLPVRADFLWAHPGLDITSEVMTRFNTAK
jgi:Skp family chaperone for outer membrane proteins